MGLYSHLSSDERHIIARMRARKASISHIARTLGRSASTISREIQRNTTKNSDHAYYTHSRAHEFAVARRRQRRPQGKLTPEEWGVVVGYIRDKWSPQQVSNYLAMRTHIRISTESIYQYIYRQVYLEADLRLCLRHRFRKRRKRYRSYDSRGILRNKLMIDARPDYINNRSEVGHWELDTVLGTGSKACILTITERKTGFLYIGKLASRTVQEVNKRLIAFIRSSHIPVKTITSDNGTEFHGYKDVEKATSTTFYFAHPHHAWERGTNENTNGLIRQYLPKGSSMHHITQWDCNAIVREINSRPRKRHQYRSPNEVVVGN